MPKLTKWDKRYQTENAAGEPCWLLQHQQHLLTSSNSPAPLKSLDVACGLGANALALATLGYESHAWDNSTVALDKLEGFAKQQQLHVHSQCRDIEQQPPEAESFDVIVVSQFLHRPLCKYLSVALKPGGLLFYQTFHCNKQSGSGPSSNDYLLKPNELLTLFADLNMVFYREDTDVGDLKQGLRDLAYFVGKKSV